MHALKAVPLAKGGRGVVGGLSEYAERIGRGDSYISHLRAAAKVVTETSYPGTTFPYDLADKAKHLYEISKAPRVVWPQLVTALEKHSWTVAQTSAAVSKVGDFFTRNPLTDAHWMPGLSAR